MDLMNRLAHMAGQKILVNGTTYEVGKNGVARGLKAEDAQKLLSFAEWRPLPQRSGAPTVTNSGQSRVPELKPEPDPEPEIESEESEAGDEPEYPDPSMDMTVAELREIADAYEVPTAGKTKRTLVQDIMAAMYPSKQQ